MPKHTRPQNKSVHTRPTQSNVDEPVASIPTTNGEVLITRRHLLYGAAGIAGVAVVAGGAGVVAPLLSSDSSTIQSLNVSQGSVSNLDDCTEFGTEQAFSVVGNFEMPYGTLVWNGNDTVAACLLPTETPNPLTQVALLMLGSGDYNVVLDKAVGAEEGFEIYDVRCTQTGLVWTEANILEGIWRIFIATVSNQFAVGEPRQVDEGSGDWETPSIAAVNNRAFWQVMPKMGTDASKTEESLLKSCTFSNGSNVETLYTSQGRMACPVGASKDGVTITPRVPQTSSYYSLIYLESSSGQTADSLTLPSGMKPLAVSWGDTGFSFCFQSIYDYGGGIANLGTYTPKSKPDSGNYDNASWFRFGRTPLGAPCWCNGFLVVKSTQSVCAVDLENLLYCAFGIESGCDDYGDILATSGSCSTVLSVANIKQSSTSSSTDKEDYTLVRVWAPLSNKEVGEEAIDDE